VHVRLQLELPADAKMLTRTRWALLGYLEELGAGEDTTADVILALDEACANVVRHAFPTGPGSFRLAADITDREVLVQVEDDGVGFDVGDLGTRRIEPDAVSGRGLGIIRTLMTSVEVESPLNDGGTRLTMRRLL
jgi:anti-sigma regulatory factor (Ser/Thr protein kinase)